MKNIVTGAAGFIGSHQAEELLKKGEDVVGIDNFHKYYSEKIKRNNLEKIKETAEKSEGEFKFIEGSITDEEALNRLPSEVKHVYHHAAIAGVRYSIEHPNEYAEINVLGTSKLIEYLDEIEKFVFTSSSSVYGEVPREELPVKEDRELDPIAPYPLSKKQAEEMVRLYSSLYSFDYAIVRPFTVYGPRQRPDEAFTKFINMILNDDPVTIYGDGEQSRDFTYVKDLVHGCISVAENGEGTYNLGSNRRVTVNQMVNTLNQLMDREVEKKHVEQPQGDVRHTHANINKAKETGYKPDTEFVEGAEKCVEWVKEMKNKKLL